MQEYPLNPNDSTTYTKSATLYFRFLNTGYLVPMTVDIKTSSNARPEEALLQKLFAAKEKGGLYTTAIPEGLELISVFESGDTLFITLSSELIDNTEYTNDSEINIAVCQIINTVTDYSGKSIQLMVDKEGKGSGNRVSYSELGFDKELDKKYDYASAFKFIKQMVVTPSIVLGYVLESLRGDDLTNLNTAFAASTQRRSISSTDVERFVSKYRIKTYSVMNEHIDTDYAVVNCKIYFEILETGEEHVFVGELTMPRYDYVYKVPYDQLSNAAGGKE